MARHKAVPLILIELYHKPKGFGTVPLNIASSSAFEALRILFVDVSSGISALLEI